MKQEYKEYLVRTMKAWGGLSLLFLLIIFFVIMPQHERKKQLKKQLAEKKQLHQQALKASQEETQIMLNKEIDSLREDLRKFVTDSQNTANLTFDISRIANENALGSFNINSRQNPGEASMADNNSVGQQQIEVAFTADFNQFASFLNSLERNRPIVFIDKFIITRSNKQSQEHLVKMTLSVFVKKTTKMVTKQ